MKIIINIAIIILFAASVASASENENILNEEYIDMSEAQTKDLSEREIIDFIDLIFSNNAKYSQEHGYEYFQTFANKQTPHATVVLCSDSRVQTSVFDGNRSVNNFFLIRNIGNQIETARGSVEFGVRHLHTPLLLIIGHSGCGAIDASLKDYSKESPAIQKELSSLKLPLKNLSAAIKFNVHQQVNEALKMFDDLIKDKKLVILGLLYDFRDDYKQGYGSLILVNINGETNPKKIKINPYLKSNKNIPIGIGE